MQRGQSTLHLSPLSICLPSFIFRLRALWELACWLLQAGSAECINMWVNYPSSICDLSSVWYLHSVPQENLPHTYTHTQTNLVFFSLKSVNPPRTDIYTNFVAANSAYFPAAEEFLDMFIRFGGMRAHLCLCVKQKTLCRWERVNWLHWKPCDIWEFRSHSLAYIRPFLFFSSLSSFLLFFCLHQFPNAFPFFKT